MATKSKPYEQFGPYILFKKLESDALGELFRAARIEGGRVGPFLALRRLSGGDRAALSTAAEVAAQVVGSLTGPTFVRDQQIGVVAAVPTVVHEYATGRSLRHIVDRARGAGAAASPIPTDQAIVIAERVATSLATTAELRFAGDRLLHGGLIPQFVWISDDGEIRVAGQSLGAGLVASLRDEKVAADIGRYFAPEMHHGAAASKSTEVYALGAILYLVLTGLEPPDPTRTSAFTYAIRGAKTMDGAAMPAEVRVILERSLNIDPASRYDSPADMRAALSALVASGGYSATSFNLAFYLSTLLKKELEGESAERERESSTNVAAFAVADTASAAAPAPVVEEAEAKSKMPLAIAATLCIAIAGAGSWFFLAPKKNVNAAQPAAVAAMVPPPAATSVPQAPPVVLEPIVASAGQDAAPAAPETATANAAAEEAARKKAFDDAVKQRLQQELQKLQAEYTRQLQQQQRRDAPVLTTAEPQSVPAATPARTTSVAQVEPARPEVAVAQEQPPTLPAASTATVANRDVTPVTPPVAPPVTATAAPAAVRVVREGDVVDVNELDAPPSPLREPRPVYPPIAVRQRIEATVMASILISEKGEVIDVKILRGDPRFGFNDAATRAFRGARYTSPMKDGKRVKTWVAQMIQFKP